MSDDVVRQINGGVIISCQAFPGDPFYGPTYMAAFARAAERGGAVGIRANGAKDVAAIREAVSLPIIGIWKRPCNDRYGYIITPSVEDARQLVSAGADIIAADVGDRPRPGDLSAADLVRAIRGQLGVPLMADCSSLEDAVGAEEAGADLVATTLGLPGSLGEYEPNLKLLAEMKEKVQTPVVAEGRFWDPGDVEKAFGLGAWAVVIGSAVTRPRLITERLVRASPAGRQRAAE
jgi:N-acylglucosamine-6-phosphate 2-epimerase